MATQFGDRIRMLRTKQRMLLRHVASALDMDTALLSKIERGNRVIKKEQIPLVATVLNADKEELLVLWLADQVYDVLHNEPMADKALRSVSQKIKSNEKKK